MGAALAFYSVLSLAPLVIISLAVATLVFDAQTAAGRFPAQMGKAAVGSAYGAAGSFVVMLVWICYSVQILFFGAELTHTFFERQGAKQSGQR